MLHEIHLFPARGYPKAPVVLSEQFWSALFRVALANGAREVQSFTPFEARNFAKAIRYAIERGVQPSSANPFFMRHNSGCDPIEFLGKPEHLASLSAALGIFEAGDGVCVERAISRSHRAQLSYGP